MNEKLIYTNELGVTVEISHLSNYFLERVEGLDAIKNNIQTSKTPYQDGVTVTSENLGPRDVIIEGSFRARQESVIKQRRTLLQVFSPKLEGKLRYEYGDFNKEIYCKVELAPVFPHVDSKFKKFMIQLVCPNPYWLDQYEIGEEITTWMGGLQFPFSLPFTLRQRGETRQNIYNSGDEETPVEIIFRGPALNPKVANLTTGEFIRIKRELTSDDTLYITTHFGDKKVEIERNGVRQNAFNYIDLDSTFFSLVVGDNLIEYTTESVLDSQGVEIRYYNRYLGV